MLLQEMTWPEIGKLSRDLPVIVPVAALEQHGHHLPVFVDSMLLGEVMRRVNETMRDRALFTPLMWLGNSHHHIDFQGTMSASPRVYLDLLNDMAENLLTHGFRRIVFVNGHGGNTIPGRQAVFEMRQRHRERKDLLLLFATYWDSANPNEGRSDLVQKQMGHACEWETSMVLRLNPALVVGPVQDVPEVPHGEAFAPGHRAWVMPDRSEPGHIGHPSSATAEKGEALFAHFAAGVEKYLERVVNWTGAWE